ncbi:hypothetical protein E8E11_005251 [Didymella keratinophila]|nr:hypothetical protein E8E11_005251 [Didymella keratinophila]
MLLLSLDLRKFGWDDGFTVVALAFGICMAVVVSIGVRHGYGLHLADIADPNERELALKFTYISPAPSILASTSGKISMVLFLSRLLGHLAKRRHRWFLFGVTVVMVALNIFTIGIIARTMLARREELEAMDTRQMSGAKLAGYWWRTTGGAAAATFVKVYYMRDMTKLADVTYAWGPLALWYMAEVFVLIMMGSLPTLKPIVSYIRGHMPSVGSYVLSKKQRTGGSKITTVGSKSSNGFRHCGQGDITIALNEIDNISRQ